MNSFISPDFLHHLTLMLLMACAGFSLAMLLTPTYTFFAYKYTWWKLPATVTGEKLSSVAKLHAAKHSRNIPMMAGLVFIAAVTCITIIFNLDHDHTWLPLAAFLAGGLVGFIDDIINIRARTIGVRKLRGPIKFCLLAIIGLTSAWFFYYQLGLSSLYLPFAPYTIELGWLIIPLFAFVVVAAGTAMNITDGLDGLAGGLAAMAFGAFGVIALLQGNIGVAGFCFTLVGALLAYVWFNIYPARFFMGDVGSFALGAALGVVAILTHTLPLLPIIGLLFVVEAGSSLLHVVSRKLLKKNIFITAPVHHHFEAIGWPETKVTMRFWVVGNACATIGVVLAITGGYI